MKVLVCGGRDYQERDYVFKELDKANQVLKIDCIVSGMAKGVDSYAAQWAKSRHVGLHPFPANWNKYGKAAGPIRNQQMIDEGKPDLVLAFSGGTGTNDMINKAKKHNIEVITY